MMRTGTPVAKPFTNESKDKNGRRCTIFTRICTRWWEPRSLGTVKKAKALWSVKAAKDREDEFYDPTHQKEPKPDWYCRKITLKVGRQRWRRRWNGLKPPMTAEFGVHMSFCLSSCPPGWRPMQFVPCVVGLVEVSKVNTKNLQRVWEGPCWEGM